MTESTSTAAAMRSHFAEITADIVQTEFRNQQRIQVPVEHLAKILEFLCRSCGFDLLVDITCVDYLHYRNATDRFALVYLLANTTTNERLTLRVMLNEPQLTAPSATHLWVGADWMEREVWDMFGICFEGHPDLRRILMPEEFTAHPLRKDYPLQGRGERHNFPVIARADA